MDTIVLQNALRECARRATEADVYVVHHAVNFAMAFDTLRDLGPPSVGALCRLVGIEFIARAERCNPAFTHPSHETVRLHVRWIVSNLPENAKRGKLSRWIGFAAGAAARIGLPKGYYCKDIADAGDIERLAAVAAIPNASRHLRAHVGLGYMQGWLWAYGEASINDYRRMNMPPDVAFQSGV